MRFRMINPWQTAAAAVVAVALAMTGATTATAATVDSGTSQKTPPALTTQQKADQQQVELLLKHAVTTKPDGSVSVDAAKARAVGVSQRVIDDYSRGLARAAHPKLLAANQCRGTNDYGLGWGGPWAQLDSCGTADVIGKLNNGASFAELAGTVTAYLGLAPAAEVAAVVGGVLAIGGAVISYASSDGNGVVLHIFWSGLPYATAP